MAAKFGPDKVIFPISSDDPSDAVEGQMFYRQGKGLRVHDGTAWADVYEKPFNPADYVSSGLIAWYNADSYSSNVLNDKVNSYNASTSGVSTTSETFSNGKAWDVIQGGTSSNIVFPSGILPSTYTLFHVAKYNGTEERIFSGNPNNWLSGFWNGNAGVAFHEGWLSPEVDNFGTSWVLSTDQNSRYRGKGAGQSRVEYTGGGGVSTSLRVNGGTQASEASDYKIAEIIVYNRTLSSSEYTAIEAALEEKYGI